MDEKELKNIIVSTYDKHKKKNRFSKFIVALVVALNCAFTLAVLYIFYRTGGEPTALIGCWFAFTTGELWMLSSIKKTKVKGGGDK